MISSLRAHLVTALAVTLAGCASGYGGADYPGPGLPPAGGPPTPPDGGPVDVLVGQTVLARTDGTTGAWQPGEPSQVVLTFANERELTLTISGDAVATFDLAQTVPTIFAPGVEIFIDGPKNGWTYYQMFAETFSGPGTVAGLAGTGGAAISPDVPASGVATFDTSMNGAMVYAALPGDELFFTRGAVKADFGAGVISGTFADVDFASGGQLLETTRLGHDFGIAINGAVTGPEFDLAVSTTKAASAGEFLDMSGVGLGTFRGEPPGSLPPDTISGAIALASEPAGAALAGGFTGRCVCFEP
jgi:hypothetical protein